ncbi:MAG: ABC transporter ATP-binding protein [Candidatus Omnitrophota bacterium]
MENILEIVNLKVNFSLGLKDITALSGVNLHIAPQETVVLAGESGSGKTITALAITRILPANARIIEGEVRFCGRGLLGRDEVFLAGIRGSEIAYVFQEPAAYLNPVYTIGNQIAEVLMQHQNKGCQAAYLEAEKLLSLVKIKEPRRVLMSYPHQLSGGMNQRAFIAMALASQPKLLIADEPTTSLDVTTETEILRLLGELKESLGFSLLFITHNLAIARKIADRIYIMYQGKIVEEGAKEGIFKSPSHFHTRELIAAYERIGYLKR